MRIKNNKSGFTLLEIIIVIIIVGVLASLALPRFFSTVEFSRSTEALNAMGVLRQSIERCYIANAGNYVGCNAITAGAWNLDLEDPGVVPGTHFTYALSGQSNTVYQLQANRNTVDGGTTTDWIRMNYTTTGVARSGTGKFIGIK